VTGGWFGVREKHYWLVTDEHNTTTTRDMPSWQSICGPFI